jgi:hypothetical protein
MKTVTKKEAIDMLLANNYRAIDVVITVDYDGEDIDVYLTRAYVSKEDKHVPLTINEKHMDMYDILFIQEYNKTRNCI